MSKVKKIKKFEKIQTFIIAALASIIFLSFPLIIMFFINSILVENIIDLALVLFGLNMIYYILNKNKIFYDIKLRKSVKLSLALSLILLVAILAINY